MSLNPSTVTVTGLSTGAKAQFTAYGRFIHPDETRDISTEVTWTTSVPDIATVDSKGLVTTTGLACGTTTVTATAGRDLQGVGSDSNIRTATATFTVRDPILCPNSAQ